MSEIQELVDALAKHYPMWATEITFGKLDNKSTELATIEPTVYYGSSPQHVPQENNE